MNKRIKITIFAICTLLMSMIVPTVLAATVYSTAYVDYGSTSWATGVSQTLNTNGLGGTVYSYTNSTGTADQKLRGEMWTQGCCISMQRSSAEVAPKTSTSMPGWGNPNQETGTFYAKGRAQYGNHEGYSRVSQIGH